MATINLNRNSDNVELIKKEGDNENWYIYHGEFNTDDMYGEDEVVDVVIEENMVFSGGFRATGDVEALSIDVREGFDCEGDATIESDFVCGHDAVVSGSFSATNAKIGGHIEADDVSAEGDFTVKEDVIVRKDLWVKHNMTATNLHVGRNAEILGALSVEGEKTIKGEEIVGVVVGKEEAPIIPVYDDPDSVPMFQSTMKL